MTRLISCLCVHDFGDNRRDVDVDLMKKNVCFWIRMSAEGVGAKHILMGR